MGWRTLDPQTTEISVFHSGLSQVCTHSLCSVYLICEFYVATYIHKNSIGKFRTQQLPQKPLRKAELNMSWTLFFKKAFQFLLTFAGSTPKIFNICSDTCSQLRFICILRFRAVDLWFHIWGTMWVQQPRKRERNAVGVGTKILDRRHGSVWILLWYVFHYFT